MCSVSVHVLLAVGLYGLVMLAPKWGGARLHCP
jgi:hypothetical protein